MTMALLVALLGKVGGAAYLVEKVCAGLKALLGGGEQ